MTTESAPQDTGRAALWRDTNFRWLFVSALITMFGDQFTLIALPWLVLKLTGDTVALGTVLAVMSVPRAVFILIGGALVDRYSPKSVLMITKYINTALLAVLGFLVWNGTAGLPAIYALALGLGISTAFSFPAGSSILPLVVRPALLLPANGILMGFRQLSMLLGPMLAGGLIVLGGDQAAPGGTQNAKGLALAFLINAATYAASAWTLAHLASRTGPTAPAVAAQSVLRSVFESLRHFWHDLSLRVLCLYFAATSFFVGGPLQVALPVLADLRLGGGASAFGMLAGAHGAGTLIGMAISGLRPNWRLGNLGLTILAVDAAAGVLLLPLGMISLLWQGMVLLVAIGMLSGYIQVTVYTWLQRRVPPTMLGRAMALFMFIFMGLAPLSSALTGWLLRFMTLTQLFVGCGVLLVVLALMALTTRTMRSIAEAEPPPAGARPSV